MAVLLSLTVVVIDPVKLLPVSVVVLVSLPVVVEVSLSPLSLLFSLSVAEATSVIVAVKEPLYRLLNSLAGLGVGVRRRGGADVRQGTVRIGVAVRGGAAVGHCRGHGPRQAVAGLGRGAGVASQSWWRIAVTVIAAP